MKLVFKSISPSGGSVYQRRIQRRPVQAASFLIILSFLDEVARAKIGFYSGRGLRLARERASDLN